MLVKQTKAKQTFIKCAKVLNIRDIESELGRYLSDTEESNIRKKITLQEKKRYPLRHPILTGVPTLGLSPAISKATAVREIITSMARGSTQYRKELADNTRQKEIIRELYLSRNPRINYRARSRIYTL